MAADRLHHRPRRTLLRIGVQAAIGLVALGWFTRFAYIRITTPPAPMDAFAIQEDAAAAAELDAATTALLDALANLPASPTFDEPAPDGMMWMLHGSPASYIDPSDILNGPWDPSGRAHLRVVIRYLTDPAMTDVLDEVRRLRERPFRAGLDFGPFATGRPVFSYSAFRNLAKLLVARARYQHAERRDMAAAWEDLKTVLLLGKAAQENLLLHWLVVQLAEALCLGEIQQMCREVRLDPVLAADVQHFLTSHPEPLRDWAAATAGETAFGWWVYSACFTDDAHGDGWLVLGDQSWLARWGWGGFSRPWPPAEDRSRLWNLASPLFNGRRTVKRKLETFSGQLAAVAGMTYQQALVALERLDTASPALSILNGPPAVASAFSIRAPNPTSLAYRIAVTTTAELRAARIMVAVNRFKQLHGRYPGTLEELVPNYLELLPLDPYCNRPFGYRVAEDDDYLLYSCGPDGDDDGGQPGPNPYGRPAGYGDEGDHVHTLGRFEPRHEPDLRPVPDSGPSDIGTTGDPS